MLAYIFSPPLHAAIPSLLFAKASFRSRSSVAVRLPQHRLFAPRKIIISAIATIIFFCGAWGCLIADY